jgi:protein phosphatase
MKRREFIIHSAAATDVGGRKNNEDAYLVNKELGLFIVADGMGGHEKGEVASLFTSENLEMIIDMHTPSGDSTMDEVSIDGFNPVTDDELIEYAVMTVNRQLYEMNEEMLARQFPPTGKGDDAIGELLRKRARMGTTIVSLLIREGRAFIANVGDSRAYHISDGGLRLLTRDHSWVAEKLREGEITPEEAKTHEKRNIITRSVGFKPDVKVDLSAMDLIPPERFLLCSDGLTNAVSEPEMLKVCGGLGIQAACDEIVGLAKQNGARDNITAIIVDVQKGRAAPQEFTDI